jgi:group I intron endonuclease
MKIYQIYKATCFTTKKIYIGYTSNFDVRKATHKKNSENGKEQSFYCAIRKYGWKDFSWEILYCSKDKEHTLRQMEPYFISLFDSMNPKFGYNMTSGGYGGNCSEETKKKISLSKLGKKRSPETIEKMRKALTGRKVSKEALQHMQEGQLKRYKTKPSKLKGTHHSEETKKKIGKASKGNTHRLGKPQSEETKKKISQNMKDNFDRKHQKSIPK